MSISSRLRGWIIPALIILAVAGGVAWQFGPRLVYRFFGDVMLKVTEGGLSQAQAQELSRSVGDLKAKLAWSSSRTGNHELYLMKLPDTTLYRLTENDFVDYYPRFSPDGNMLVWARSRQSWVSERDYDAWDVWVMDLRSGKERRVAELGNFPQWVDAGHVSYMRRAKVVVQNLDTGEEKVIFDGEKPPNEGRIETPELCPGNSNLLAFTGRGKLWGNFVADLGKGGFVKLGDGCEITWAPPDCDQLLMMDSGGNGGTQVTITPMDRPDPKVFMDLPGGRSHEYFPRLSRDGKWLVWGACADGHEHDIADYDIFLWKVGSPWDQALRITYNPANDRWPDIFIEP